MTQDYSDPMPKVETFHVTETMWETYQADYPDNAHWTGPGWYWWTSLPGCLPDSEPLGPFDSEDDALADAQVEFDID